MAAWVKLEAVVFPYKKANSSLSTRIFWDDLTQGEKFELKYLKY